MTTPQPVTDPAGIADARLEIAVRETLQRLLDDRGGHVAMANAVVSIAKAAIDHRDAIEALAIQARDHDHDELIEELLANVPESFGDDIPAEQIAVRWVRHLEGRLAIAEEKLTASEARRVLLARTLAEAADAIAQDREISIPEQARWRAVLDGQDPE